MARWQRERRQQTLIVTVFSAILFFTLGLVAWAATSRYYSDNLKPSLTVDGRSFAMRDFKRELGYELTAFYPVARDSSLRIVEADVLLRRFLR